MVSVPNQLVWEVVKNNNAFLRKKNGRSKRSGTMRFSVEKGNLRSLSSYKHSGLANDKSVDIVFTDDNKASLCKRTASKTSTVTIEETPVNKNFKRVVKTISSQVVDSYYRPDLKKDLLAKHSRVYCANRIAKGIKKPVEVKRGRS